MQAALRKLLIDWRLIQWTGKWHDLYVHESYMNIQITAHPRMTQRYSGQFRCCVWDHNPQNTSRDLGRPALIYLSVARLTRIKSDVVHLMFAVHTSLQI